MRIGADTRIDPAEFRGCSTLVHLAAHIPARHDDVEEAARCWEVNVHGTLRLLEAAAQAGVGRFIQTSSGNAYAPWATRPDEKAPLFPASREYYLGSKIAQELYAQSFCRTAGISTAVLRLGSVYGPHPNTVSRMAERLLLGKTVELVDEGRFGADFVSVEDVSNGLLLVLGKSADGCYNLASGVRTTIAELADHLRAITGAPRERVSLLPASGKHDPGFPALDIGRIQALGYEPASLDEGLRRLVDGLRSSRLRIPEAGGGGSKRAPPQ